MTGWMSEHERNARAYDYLARKAMGKARRNFAIAERMGIFTMALWLAVFAVLVLIGPSIMAKAQLNMEDIPRQIEGAKW